MKPSEDQQQPPSFKKASVLKSSVNPETLNRSEVTGLASSSKYNPKGNFDEGQASIARVKYADREEFTRNVNGKRARTIEFSQGHGGHGGRTDPTSFGGPIRRGPEVSTPGNNWDPPTVPNNNWDPPTVSQGSSTPDESGPSLGQRIGKRLRGMGRSGSAPQDSKPTKRLGIDMQGFGGTTGTAGIRAGRNPSDWSFATDPQPDNDFAAPRAADRVSGVAPPIYKSPLNRSKGLRDQRPADVERPDRPIAPGRPGYGEARTTKTASPAEVQAASTASASTVKAELDSRATINNVPEPDDSYYEGLRRTTENSRLRKEADDAEAKKKSDAAAKRRTTAAKREAKLTPEQRKARSEGKDITPKKKASSVPSTKKKKDDDDDE